VPSGKEKHKGKRETNGYFFLSIYRGNGGLKKGEKGGRKASVPFRIGGKRIKGKKKGEGGGGLSRHIDLPTEKKGRRKRKGKGLSAINLRGWRPG